MKELFKAKSIAVIGATNNPKKVGYAVLDNLIRYKFEGKIYPVNPHDKTILDLPCSKKISDIDDEIDLVMIAVPNTIVPQVLEESGKKGVKYAVIISSGFGEIGEEGKKLEKQLLDIKEKYGIRIVGPNCLGFMDTFHNLNATFATKMPEKGVVAFLSQSGALCTAILDWSAKVNFGFSKFISIGNNIDVHETDFLRYLADDDETKVILMYIEGVHNGKEFFDAAAYAANKKPVIVMKSGRTEKGAKAAFSHTGSIAGADTIYDCVFEKAGVIRARDVNELFELARIFKKLPAPKNRKIGIVTNAGGPGVLAIDAVSDFGIETAKFSDKTLKALKEKMPMQANIHNPVDVIGDATAHTYKHAIDIVLDDEDVGSLFVILTPQKMTEIPETANVIIEMAKKHGKPIATSFMGGVDTASGSHMLRDAKIPNFDTPYDGVKALAGLIRYYVDMLKREKPEFVKFDIEKQKKDNVKKIIEEAKNQGRDVLSIDEGFSILDAYGIKVPKGECAKTEQEAVEISKKLGYPVVMKIDSSDVNHKSDIGAIVIGISSDDEARLEFNKIMQNVKKHVQNANISGITIQKQIKGREFVLAVNRDEQFGHFMTFGFGGIYVEILKDVSNRLLPISKQDTQKLIHGIKSHRILEGIRGEPPADIDSVAEAMLRLSQLCLDLDVSVFEINPLIVLEKGNGCYAVDVRVKI